MKYKKIDAHIHFWDLTNGYNNWVKATNFPSLITPVNLNANAFVHVEAHTNKLDPLCEYKWIKNSFPHKNIKVVAQVDFTQNIEGFKKDISNLAQADDIVGVRQIMATTTKSTYSPFNENIPSDLTNKLAILREYNLIFEAQLYPEQYLQVLDSIASSGVTMVIEHFGLPILAGNDNLLEWQEFIKQVSQNYNWYLKLSAFDLNNDINDVHKALNFILDNITTDKLCYGSNFPISQQNNYSSWQGYLLNYLDDDVAIKDIFLNVANKVYFKNNL